MDGGPEGCILKVVVGVYWLYEYLEAREIQRI